MKKFTLILILILASIGYGQNGIGEKKYAKALAFYKSREYKKALRFEKEKDYPYYSVKQFVLFANCHGNLREFKKENKLLSIGLSIFPKSDYLYSCRAYFFQRMRAYEKSIRDFGLAYKFAEIDTVKYVYLGARAWSKFLSRDFEGAIEDANAVLEYDSLSTDALNTLGIVYDGLEEYEKAEKYLLKSYELDTSNITLIGNLGFLYQHIDAYKESLFYFDKAINMNPKFGFAYNNRSYSKLMLGDIEGALKDVNTSIALYPNNSYAHRNRALIYIEMKKYKKACEDIHLSLRLEFTKTWGNEMLKLSNKYCN